ncbi:MAG: hypothetical protein OXH31_01695 [Gammaproteobacteria bacterium]|nr:hypothetical protein [Gammaproteobacteria bacterium]
MTDCEQREQNWVQHRFDCSIDSIYSALVQVIQDDVDKFNKLTADKKNGTQSFCCKKQNGALVIERPNEGDFVCVRKERDRIFVEQNESTIYELRKQWDCDKVDCRLMIGEQSYSIYQLSQRALIKLLFKD